jgi:hypothetical protein
MMMLRVSVEIISTENGSVPQKVGEQSSFTG